MAESLYDRLAFRKLNLDVEALTLDQLEKYCQENKLDLIKGKQKGK